MLKMTEEALARLESGYPGILEYIREIEASVLPACTSCESEDTAKVNCGLGGRTISLSAATTKFKLVPNRSPSMGDYFCNECREFFDAKTVCW